MQNSAAYNHALLDAGRFGFQKEMHALSSLKQPNAEENHNVQALLNSTQEIEDRYKIIWRWWRVWRPDVRAGWVVLGRFKVTHPITKCTFASATQGKMEVRDLSSMPSCCLHLAPDLQASYCKNAFCKLGVRCPQV